MDRKQIMSIMNYLRDGSRYSIEETNTKFYVVPYKIVCKIDEETHEMLYSRDQLPKINCIMAKLFIPYYVSELSKEGNHLKENFLFIRTKENLTPFITFGNNISLCIEEDGEVIEMFDLISPTFIHKEVHAFDNDEVSPGEIYYDILIMSPEIEE